MTMGEDQEIPVGFDGSKYRRCPGWSSLPGFGAICLLKCNEFQREACEAEYKKEMEELERWPEDDDV